MSYPSQLMHLTPNVCPHVLKTACSLLCYFHESLWKQEELKGHCIICFKIWFDSTANTHFKKNHNLLCQVLHTSFRLSTISYCFVCNYHHAFISTVFCNKLVFSFNHYRESFILSILSSNHCSLDLLQTFVWRKHKHPP